MADHSGGGGQFALNDALEVGSGDHVVEVAELIDPSRRLGGEAGTDATTGAELNLLWWFDDQPLMHESRRRGRGDGLVVAGQDGVGQSSCCPLCPGGSDDRRAQRGSRAVDVS